MGPFLSSHHFTRIHGGFVCKETTKKKAYTMINKFLRSRKASKGGFSLLELLVAIAVIAILAVLIIPQLSGATQAARNAAAIDTRNSANHASEEFEGASGVSFTDATAALANADVLTGGTLTTVIAGATVDFGLNSNPSAVPGVAYDTANFLYFVFSEATSATQLAAETGPTDPHIVGLPAGCMVTELVGDPTD